MKKSLLLLIFLYGINLSGVFAQSDQSTDTIWKTIYRASAPKINDLVHTKLDVRFDIPKSIMYGKAWVTLEPHFYPTDSLTLDTKYMAIKEVAMQKGKSLKKLPYTYDSLQLHIKLDKTYQKGEKYTVYIDYIAQPEQVKLPGSAAITDAKGLYFINPKGDGKWPTQIWTQGETESNSVWMPTIDKPDQKSTEEITMTVPAKWVTLSNGTLDSQKKNPDGTRTDSWSLKLPHAPYLFFMGAGPFTIVKDSYKGMPVNYYVEPQYASVAKGIFGETPAMIGYFSKILNFPYVWPKYDQMVGREYVSGAMENTTATLHQDGAYQNARELVDGNVWEETIAHELFHHWFGDLATAESWSNLTVNESFADYAQYLWDEHRHGKDYADDKAYQEMQGYLLSNSSDKDLVRFYYPDKEAMFDAVSYNKGGRILHMLRNFVGDSAFFQSLNRYLTFNKFKAAESHHLRLAFEAVTGLDMNWFWNEWYFGAGQPNLTINYDYKDGVQTVVVNQTQKGQIFTLPVYIDLYSKGANKESHRVWLRNATDTFRFAVSQKPTLVNFDAQKVLLAVKKDNKDSAAFEHQYKYAPTYLDRREALEFFGKKDLSKLVWGLNDKYSGLRRFTINRLKMTSLKDNEDVLNKIEKIAQNDPDKLTKAAALEYLANLGQDQYKSLFEKNVHDSSYSVSGAALLGLATLEPENSYQLAKEFSKDMKGKLEEVVTGILYTSAKPSDFEMLDNLFNAAPLSQAKLTNIGTFGKYLSELKNAAQVKQGAQTLMNFRNSIPEQYRQYTDPGFKQVFDFIAQKQEEIGNTDVANFVQGLMK